MKSDSFGYTFQLLEDREGTMPFRLISVCGSNLPANFSPTSPVEVNDLTRNTQDF